MSPTQKLAVVTTSGLNVRDANEENRIGLRAAIKRDPTGAVRRALNVDTFVVVMGLRDEDSIAYFAARELIARGAHVGVTFWNEKIRSRVQPIADALGVDWCLPCDVESDEEIFDLFKKIPTQEGWEKARISVLHSIAFATKIAMQPITTVPSKEALGTISVSGLSFGRVIEAAIPLMGKGSTAMALGYSGADRLEDGYDGAIGVAKNTLEFVMKSAAKRYGPHGIRVVCISPGPMKTSAASGISTIGEMRGRFLVQSPMHTEVEGRHVGGVIANHFAEASELVSGVNLLIDGGRSVVA